MKISTKELGNLPDIENLKKLCKSLSTLDAIICRDWEYRYYSYQNDWDLEIGEECMEMRNGCGDYFFVLFTKNGAIINGFDHESEMNGWQEIETEQKSFFKKILGKKETELKQQIWKGVIDKVPNELKHFILDEPIKSIGTTFCIWRKNDDAVWNIGDIEFPKSTNGDGSESLLYILDNNPITYKNWASEYYEEQFEENELQLDLVKHIYDFKPLTKEILMSLNPYIDDFESLKVYLEGIGYPYEEF